MPNRIFSLVLFSVAAIGVASAQNRDADSETLREILTELRSMHEDMRVTETTQLLVAELEMQQGVVSRAMESADTARAKLNDIHVEQKRLAAEINLAEEQMDKAVNADEKNSLTQETERRKANLETMKALERDANTANQDMEQRLENAQDKLSTIESELNAAISRLGPAVKGAAQR